MAVVRAKTQAKTRRDPVRRTSDGVSPLAQLVNRDPNKKYVWVNTADTLAGVDYYLSMGYEIEENREGGVQQVGFGRNPFRKSPEGKDSYLMFQGNVLMSCSKEQAEDLELYGPDGSSGQLKWDELEKQITGHGHGSRLLRNVPGIVGRDGDPVIRVENETSNPEVELGV